jgi:hypothetical protein
MTIYTALFPLGKIVQTSLAKDELDKLNYSPLNLLRKHMSGDWSEMHEDDQQSNHNAIQEGSRIFSAYIIDGTKFWVITEADRSSTTILLPSEY